MRPDRPRIDIAAFHAGMYRCAGRQQSPDHTGDRGRDRLSVDDEPILASIDGLIRGLLPSGTPVHKGMKSGDIDPRPVPQHCYTVSDKARAIGGGVLEAILMLQRRIQHV